MDLEKLNSATKYPSILTYHEMGDRGRLVPTVQVPFPAGQTVHLTEKVDGTNGRIVVLPNGLRRYIIGSREEFLFAQGDLIWNTTYEIKAVLEPIAERIHINPERIVVYFFEVYGAGLPAAKQYTDKKAIGVRIFDVCTVSPEILEKPVQQIASWRDHGGQWFWREEEIDLAAGSIRVDRTPSFGSAESLPTSIQNTYDWMKAFEKSRCDLGGGQGRAEGVVARIADRKAVAKLRFEDYDRTLGIRHTK